MDKYVLITPAKNEERYIERTIRSVVKQTVLPERWVIINDGSTDRTDEIVSSYAGKYEFIMHVRKESSTRDFSSKVYAIRTGCELLKDLNYRYLGILDADILLMKDYYERIMREFELDKSLGLAGGVLSEVRGDGISGRISSPWSVSGGVQVFRRECFEVIGGFIPMKKGGEDTVAEVMARMNGWKVWTYKDITGTHLKETGKASGRIWKASFELGLRDHSLGSHPVFFLFKCVRRLRERPYFLSAFLRLLGFIWGHLKDERREVGEEIVRYLRKEQMQRLRTFLHTFVLVL